MTIDDQELRRRLKETAAKASAPRFTTEDLVRRIRRRRIRLTAAVAGASWPWLPSRWRFRSRSAAAASR